MEPLEEKKCLFDIEDDDFINLVRRSKERDKSAFEQIVLRFQQYIFNLCYGFFLNTEDAEDAAQEVFVRAYFKLPGLKEDRSFPKWLTRLTVNYCLNKIKKSWPVKEISASELEREDGQDDYFDAGTPVGMGAQASNPRTQAEQKELKEIIMNKLAQLPEKQRKTVILVHLNGLTQNEAAEVLGIPIGTIKSQISRAFETLRIVLREYKSYIKR